MSLRRVLANLWMPWYVALVVLPQHSRACAVHDVPFTVASAQQSLHELSNKEIGGLREASGTDGVVNRTNHQHLAANRGTGAHEPHEDSKACCSCLGQCMISAPTGLPTNLSLEWYASVSDIECSTPDYVSVAPIARVYVQPFANGPPA